MSITTRVKVDDPFEPSAQQWNSFIDAAEYVESLKGDGKNRTEVGMEENCTVMIKNKTGDELRAFSALTIKGATITASTNLTAFKFSQSSFEAGYVEDAEKDTVVITLEPVAVDGICRAAIYGLVTAPVMITDDTHRFAIPMPNGTLNSSDHGKIRLLYVDFQADYQGNRKWYKVGLSLYEQTSPLPVLAKVESGDDILGYRCSLYPNGKTGTISGYGTVFVMQGNPQLNSLSPGTWIIVYPYEIATWG